MLLGRVGSVEAGERGRKPAGTAGKGNERREASSIFPLPVVPGAPSFSTIHFPHPLGASAEERASFSCSVGNFDVVCFCTQTTSLFSALKQIMFASFRVTLLRCFTYENSLQCDNSCDATELCGQAKL